jgi:CDP-glycerol glycerophosphotransferase
VVSQVDLRGSAGAFDALSRHGFTFRAACTTDGCELLAVPGEREPIRDETWSVSDVRLDDGCLVVRGRAPRGDVDQASLRVSGPVETTPVRLDVVVGAFEARLALVHDPWGAGETPLPPGGYRLWVHVPGRDPVGLRIAPDLATRTPLRQRSDTYRLRVQRALDGGVLLSLAAPLRDDEVGAFNQQGLQRWYASDDHRLDPESVYLQSYTGQSATDSPLAVHHALRRLHPGLTLYWGVSDRSTRVPEGAHPVLIRSREWYAAIATCGSIVTNVDMDRWFRKRPGQRLLQSFHGYPSKIMGISAWQAKNFTPLRVARQLARTSSTWDLLLTPTPAMDAHYRREYRYDGEILAAGYPRDDVLVGPDAEGIRAQTRRRLGIAPGVHVVLHAPTWRDDLATNFRRAAPTGVFDAERAAAELGEGYVILLRGHRFHRQRTDLPAERLIDVTDYPEVNDLILASDAAVFDYTSMRFDFALTGRPMMFLVPDLDRYTEGVRGFLFDFRRSAPGPLVEDTAAVVAALRDLDGLSARYGDELARFNQEFNDRQDGQAAERVVRAFFGDPVSERAGSSPEAPV